jgi:hypothetical protein
LASVSGFLLASISLLFFFLFFFLSFLHFFI